MMRSNNNNGMILITFAIMLFGCIDAYYVNSYEYSGVGCVAANLRRYTMTTTGGCFNASCTPDGTTSSTRQVCTQEPDPIPAGFGSTSRYTVNKDCNETDLQSRTAEKLNQCNYFGTDMSTRFSCNGTTVYYCSCDATCGSCGACETGTTDRCLKPGGGQLDVVLRGCAPTPAPPTTEPPTTDTNNNNSNGNNVTDSAISVSVSFVLIFLLSIVSLLFA